MMNPVACTPASLDIFVENRVSVQIGGSDDLQEELIVQVDDNQFSFETNDPHFVNKTAIVT